MKKRNVSKIIVMIFAFILIFTSMSFADTTYDYTQNININNKEQTDKINYVIEKMDKYVKYDRNKNVYYIDKTNLPSNITDEDIAIAETIIQKTNSNKANLNSSVSSKSKTLYSLAARGKKSGGVTKLVYRWYGYDLYLNHHHCNLLYSYREFPAAIAGILVPASVIGVLAWSRAIHNADRGHGVVLKLVRIRTSGSNVVAPVWVRGQ